MTQKKDIDEVQVAFDQLEKTFMHYRDSSARTNSLRAIASDKPDRADLSELEKAHLSILQSNVQAVVAKQQLRAMAQSSRSSDRLSNKVFWLNVVVVVLTAVMAASSVLELLRGKA